MGNFIHVKTVNVFFFNFHVRFSILYYIIEKLYLCLNHHTHTYVDGFMYIGGHGILNVQGDFIVLYFILLYHFKLFNQLPVL